MQAITISKTKNFMSKLLIGDVFDEFLLEEASVKTYNTFNIDGRIVPEFYDDYEFGYEFSTWQDMKSICFELIKGKQTPVSFHFILQLKPEEINKIMLKAGSALSTDEIKSFTLNIKFSNNEITVISATSMNSFIMDKTPDKVWDEYVTDFINRVDE